MWKPAIMMPSLCISICICTTLLMMVQGQGINLGQGQGQGQGINQKTISRQVSFNGVLRDTPPYFAILPEDRIKAELKYFETYGEWHQRVIVEILYFMMMGKHVTERESAATDAQWKYNKQTHQPQLTISQLMTMMREGITNQNQNQPPRVGTGPAHIEHPATGGSIVLTKDHDLNWDVYTRDTNYDRNMTEYCDIWHGITCHERSDNGMYDTCWCVTPLELKQYTWAEGTDSVNDKCMDKCAAHDPHMMAKSSAPLDAITKISLADRGLVSFMQVPGVLEQLRFLEVLDLSGNYLVGTLPKEIGNIKGLRYLDLSSCDLMGKFPPLLARLPKLQVLKLSNSNINGTLPNELFTRLTDLHTLDLSTNSLSGPITTLRVPPDSKLVNLNLSENDLTGEMPDIANFSYIESLNLSNNEISGTIPIDIDTMHKLRRFNIYHNKFTGTIPSNGQWSRMPDLTYLNLGRNALDGKIPVDIFGPELETLNLSHNYLVGKLPNEIANSDILETLHVEGNLLAGSLPKELYQLQDIADVEIYDNRFRGSISTTLCQNDIRSNFPSSYVPFPCTHFIACPKGYFHPKGHASDTNGCVPCPSCHTEDLKDESCRYIGRIECDDEDVITRNGDIDGDGKVSQREVLRLLFVTTNGGNWKDDFLKWGDMVEHPDACALPGINCKEGKVSKIDLRGVGLCQNWRLLTEDCGLIPKEIGLLDSLEVLDLSNSGGGNRYPLTIPEEIGELTELKILDLSNNNLYGLPSSISSCRKLINLNLSRGELVGTLDPVIWTLSNLEILDIRENPFHPQTIPSEIGMMTNLREFKSSRSHFMGTIPHELCKLDKMKNLEMYGNKLNGEMPECIKNLKHLSRLDIFGNDIHGKIEWLKNLPKMEILHLGVNHFSGTIPSEMGLLKSLTWVDLSENRLLGDIPLSLATLPHLVDLRLGANNIFSVPEQLCKSKSINGGKVDGTCNHILCAIGSVSARGYAVPGAPCIPCPQDETTMYVGQHACMSHDQSDFLDILYTALPGHEWGLEHIIDEEGGCNTSHVTCNDDNEIISIEIPTSTVEMDESLFTSHAAGIM